MKTWIQDMGVLLMIGLVIGFAGIMAHKITGWDMDYLVGFLVAAIYYDGYKKG